MHATFPTHPSFVRSFHKKKHIYMADRVRPSVCAHDSTRQPLGYHS
jgi:hypothetical protein